MKKQLTRIFSILLIVAAVVSPSMAQIAKKAKSSDDARSRTTVGMTLKTAKVKAKEKKGVMVTPKVRAVRAEGLKTQTGSRQILAPVSPGIVKEAADIPTIYGSVIFNSTFTQDNAPVGLYELPQGSGSTQIISRVPMPLMEVYVWMASIIALPICLSGAWSLSQPPPMIWKQEKR